MADPRPLPGSYSSASMAGLGSSMNDPYNYGMGCSVDGTPTNCSLALRLVNNGSASIDRVIYNVGPMSVEATQFLGSLTWMADQGQRVDSEDEDGIIRIDRNEDGLGHWEFFGHQSRPQNSLPTVDDVAKDRVQYTEKMERCDKYLAKLFGEGDAFMAANRFDFTKKNTATGKSPQYRGDYLYNGKIIQGHLGGYAAHLYGSRDGKLDTNVYVPLGGERRDLGEDPDGNPIDLIYYKQLGSLRNVTLAIVHIDRLPSQQVGGRMLVGKTGGMGGDGPTDRHVHLELLQGNRKTFPKPRFRRAWQLPLSSLCPP